MIRQRTFVPLALALALGAGTALSVPAATSAATNDTPAASTERQQRPSRIEGRIAFLRTELQITDAQARLWEPVATALRENDRARRDAFQSMRRDRDAKPTALERLERRQKFAELQAQSAERLRTAFEPLYAAMSDEQKRNADELLGGRQGRMGHAAMRHGH